ncbi:acetylornithine deacetylase [Marinobacter sp.]|uniref:acetylornithine deacetylase n=1 Tax=Marinobacter sp. TaxID=50741 RepID=UPI00198E9EA3|nr:acetylornithine deacetylase [Marinobacter sp.]MBD3658111.1 acetylornithine deacetylase [Marinobacter sp.]
MKRLLTVLIVLAVMAWGGYSGAVWWLAVQRLAEARIALSPHGVLARGQIGSGVSGELSLADASYQDFRLTQPVTLGKLVLDAGGPQHLLALLTDPRELPLRWSLTAVGIRLPLEATMFRNWVTAGEVSQASLFAPVCGPDHRQQLGSGDLVRLGIDELTGEALLRQEDQRLYFEVSTAGTGSIEVDWPGARLSLAEPAAVPASSATPLTLTVRDGGLMRRIAAYCARESGLDASAWTSIVMERFRDGLNARGYDASGQLLALYRQWLTEGGELTLQLQPAQPVYGIPVQKIERQGQPDPQGLVVSYNGAVVPDVYLMATEPELPAVPRQALEPVVPDGPGAALAGWRDTPVETAAEWRGQTVRVTLASGRVVEGRLLGVEESRLEVARMLDGGEVVYPMAVRAVTRFEVWRRGRARQ